MQVGHLKCFLLDPKSLVYFIVVFLGLEENFNYFISITPLTLGKGFSYLGLNPLKRATPPPHHQLAMNDFHKMVLLSDCLCLMLRYVNRLANK